MNNVYAVLLDTVSIQKYVFGSNRLKENIGASYIVSNIYKDNLIKALTSVVGKYSEYVSWSTNPEKCLIKDDNIEAEIGYIGGGNALIFFKSSENAKRFIAEWSKNLLVLAPGVRTSAAISLFDLDSFAESINMLYKKLNKNKNMFFPKVTLSKYGITADCSMSGLSAEVRYKDQEFDGYISSVTSAKLHSELVAQGKMIEEYKSFLGDDYTLTDEIDNLGQKKGESHIAIIHMDGNNMGLRFKNCKTLDDIRRLSISINDIVSKAFKNLIKDIIDKMPLLLDDKNGFNIQPSSENKKKKSILPIRPILIEGDDITFITDARLGLYLAEKLIEYLSIDSLSDGDKLTVSAGIAIIKTKYPFYRGYNIAEELCSIAKEDAHKNKGTSWVDFHISYGGFSGGISEIRKEKFTTGDGYLHFGPYIISDDINNIKSIQHLKNGIKVFEKWPRSKVKDFRTALILGKNDSKQFIKETKAQGLKLYDINGRNYAVEGWENSETPYFDMIDISEFYPNFLIEGRD